MEKVARPNEIVGRPKEKDERPKRKTMPPSSCNRDWGDDFTDHEMKQMQKWNEELTRIKGYYK